MRLSILLLIAILPSASTHAADWEPLFNGKNLDGWHATSKSPHSKASQQTSGGKWMVVDGCIVGNQDIPGNGGLLLTDRVYTDFEIRVETNNDFGPDSGLFLRCTEDGKAYQCLIDYHVGGTIGGILGEGIWNRRGVRNFTFGQSPDVIELNENFENPCPVLPDAWKHFWRVGDWNEVRARIVSDPPTMQTWVNGVKIMEHTEPKSVHPSTGSVGLQVHGGLKFGGEVRYRNIAIRSLEDDKAR